MTRAWHSPSMIFNILPCRCHTKGSKSKNKHVWLHQTKKLPYNKGSHQKNEKATYTMVENICKSYLIRDYYPKYIKDSYNSVEKRICSQTGHRIWKNIFPKKTHRWPDTRKDFNIINHRNSNQNPRQISTPTC